MRATKEQLQEWAKKGLVPPDAIRSILGESSKSPPPCPPPSKPCSIEAPQPLAPKPELLNKTEQEYRMMLGKGPWREIKAHGIKLQLGPDGHRCWYTPDFVAVNALTGMFTLFEVKGPHEWDDARVKRMAAADYCRRVGWAFVFARRHKGGRWEEEGLA